MRSLWIKIHLYLAAFFAPMLIIVAISGGLYLIGEKGEINATPVVLNEMTLIDPESAALDQDVRDLLAANNIDHDFEYVKVKGSSLFTRPTSRTHYEFKISASGMTVTKNEVDLQKAMIELHKGHGPLWFKNLQKVMALGLLVILTSGLWLGLQSPGLRMPTLVTTIAGAIVFILVGLVL